ncbi:MAG: ABC transporter permease [Ruminococcaceae bacterium]|nr:ABC transporter permease [Oscillospiraceae bacterium]
MLTERRQKTVKKNDKTIREPLFRVVKRDGMPWYKSMLIRLIAVLAALLLCSLLSIFMAKASPLEFIKTLVDGAIGSTHKLWKFAKDTAVLLCISLAITPAFRMRFWNIGAEGQTLIGALASVAIAFYLGGKVSDGLLLVIMLFASVLVGALWGGLPAFFKAKWNTNETLFTLMMNYVATGLVSYCLVCWTPTNGSVLPRLEFGHIPVVIHEYFLIIFIVLIITALIHVYLHYTKQGYEISVVGESENTARYIGINVSKVIIRTMLISGAICGLAGFLIVGALDHSINTETVGGMGFTAIMVSWLAKFNPVIMLGTSAFITFLQLGSSQISSTFNIDSSFPNMVVGIVLFFIIGCEFFIGYRIKLRESDKKGGNKQ